MKAPGCTANAVLNKRKDSCVCKAGYQQDTTVTTAVECKACPLNYYKDFDGNKDCDKCPDHSTTALTAANSINKCTCSATRRRENSSSTFQCACNPGLQDARTGSTCLSCEKGQFQNEDASSTASKRVYKCSACANGKIAPEMNATNCTACPIHHSSCNEANVCTGQTKCTKCKPGKDSGNAAYGTQCINCAAGYFNDKDGVQCIECKLGEYQNITGQTKCLKCPIGTYMDETRSSKNCKSCPFGSTTKAVGSKNATADCECGLNQDKNNQGICICSKGYGELSSESGTCIACDPGTFSKLLSNERNRECTQCENGKYQQNGQAESCDNCLPTTWSCPRSFNGTDGATANECKGQATCAACPPGRAGNDGKQCQWCGKGKYNSKTAIASCQDCAPGRYNVQEGSLSCIKCSKGKYQGASGGSLLCNDCDSGRFTNSTGAASCEACSPGKFIATKGAEQCKKCDANAYSSAGSASCTLCPTPLTVDPRLGAAKDESVCVCEAGSFLYPSVILTIVLKDTTTKEMKFDLARTKQNVRGYVGDGLGELGREVGLRTGLPLENSFEKVSLVSYGSFAGGNFRVIFNIYPKTSNMTDANAVRDLFSTADNIKSIFTDPNNADKQLWADKLNVDLTSVEIKQNCEPCPAGGKCNFGIVGEEDIAALPGYWRPNQRYARFWSCFTPSKANGKFYPWLSCFGGKNSECGPVFNFDRYISDGRQIADYLDTAEYPEMPDNEFDYYSALAVQSDKGNNDTIDYHIVKYLNDLSHHNTRHKNFVDYINSGPVRGFKSDMLIGTYSGPLCSICPSGSGRDGNFQSGSLCTPCPDPQDNTLNLIGVASGVIVALGLMIASQVTKGSAELKLWDEHQKQVEKHNALKEKKRRSSIAHGESFVEANVDHHVLKEMQELHGTYSGDELSHKTVLTGMFRILAAYMQVTALAQAVPIDWPDYVLEIFRAMETVSSPSLSMTSVDCAIATEDAENGNQASFYKKFYAMMSVPILAIAVPAAFYLLYFILGSFVLSCTGLKCWPNRISKEKKDEITKHKPKLKKMSLRRYNRHRHEKRTWRRFLITVILILFLFYTTIAKSVIQGLACQQFGEERYLIADFSIDCNGSEYNAFVPMVWLCFVVYCLGIPFAAYLVLKRYIDGIHYDPHRPISNENPTTKKDKKYKDDIESKTKLLDMKATSHGAFGFLWQGLSERGFSPYWEVGVITLRKLFMIVVIMLFQDSNKNIQMVVALMGLFVFTILHVNVKPYDAFVHDKLEILSLLVSQVTLFIGLLANFFKEDQNSDKRTMTETEASSLNYTLGMVIALVNLLFVVYFVLNLIFHVYFFMPKSVRTRLNRCCGCFCRRCKRK